MMLLGDFLEHLENIGVSIYAIGDRLEGYPREKMTPEVREALSSHQDILVPLMREGLNLAQRMCNSDPDDFLAFTRYLQRCHALGIHRWIAFIETKKGDTEEWAFSLTDKGVVGHRSDGRVSLFWDESGIPRAWRSGEKPQ